MLGLGAMLIQLPAARAIGGDALAYNTHGSRNIAMGINALLNNTTGGHNAAYGNGTLPYIETGNFNLALGFNAGLFHSTGDNNIYIGNPGNDPESNTIRIGNEVATAPLADGSIQPAHTAAFIAGIYGATTSDAGSTIPVYVDMNGNLGTAASSERFKREIKPMDKASEAILRLEPVMFHYKSDDKRVPQFGLIAEDVAKVNPNLVVHDAKGKVYTVRYDAVNAMLLNEFLKEHRKVQEQEAIINQLKSTVVKQETIDAQQEKEIRGLTANLKEQATQIQKVSAELELRRPVPQMVDNTQQR